MPGFLTLAGNYTMGLITDNHDRKKRGKIHIASPPNTWQIIYSGFVLILLSFFIMLCSYYSLQATKITRFVKSFSDAVNILSGGIQFRQGKAELIKAVEIVHPRHELARLFEDVQGMVAQLNMEETVHVALTAKGLVMRLSDAVLFDSGMADMRPQAYPLMRRIGTIITRTPREVRIEGHTDDRPIHTRRYPSNWELSTARAVRVLRYFMEAHNIPATRMVAVGYGEFQPVVPNISKANRSKNRRVEIIITTRQSSSRVEQGPS
jgi:chemotaxis protein MotB